MLLKKLFNLLVVMLCCMVFLALPPAYADDPPPPSNDKCDNKFPDLVGDICWRCMFPLRLGGNKILNTGNMPDNVNTENSNDFNPNSTFCQCEEDLGLSVGTYVSYWEPARVLEVVRKPNCFPFLFGMNMGGALNAYGAYGSKGQGGRPGDKAFYNVHYYTFPIMGVMDIIVGTEWCTDWLSDIDLAYMTEVDPLWNDDELTIFIHPEAIVFGNPIAQALCAVDCITSSAGFPLNALFWCAGCWGGLYPFTGNTGTVGSPVRTTSLLAGRLIARLARLPVPPAVEYDTSSSSAKCGGSPMPFLKKSQYKISTLSPIPETTGTCCHTFGSSPFLWGEHRNIPATGEDQTYLLWRKRNCCLKILSAGE